MLPLCQHTLLTSGTTIYKAQLDQVNNKVVLTEVGGNVVAKCNAVMLKSSTDNIEGKPTQKGIYVKKGKKYVVK